MVQRKSAPADLFGEPSVGERQDQEYDPGLDGAILHERNQPGDHSHGWGESICSINEIAIPVPKLGEIVCRLKEHHVNCNGQSNSQWCNEYGEQVP